MQCSRLDQGKIGDECAHLGKMLYVPDKVLDRRLVFVDYRGSFCFAVIDNDIDSIVIKPPASCILCLSGYGKHLRDR